MFEKHSIQHDTKTQSGVTTIHMTFEKHSIQRDTKTGLAPIGHTVTFEKHSIERDTKTSECIFIQNTKHLIQVAITAINSLNLASFQNRTPYN
ncbi:hypothetical protein [Weissella cibaria]|uniref:hypothetical protein n=1 Tax=Weissella cibaria TaxID=137591 RepID=UPI0039F04EA3